MGGRCSFVTCLQLSVLHARYRLKRGIWTSVGAGDLRRALAATERLCLLGLDNKDLRDYGVLLFHCGQYKQAYHFLETYQAREVRCLF